MADASYPRFCPVAMAASLLEPRWTMLVLCELWAGATRFNEIQRGLPGMSPGLLSRRLKEMIASGLVVRQADAAGHACYSTTDIADELRPLVRALGEWAHRNISSDVSLAHIDARMLMWNIRGKIDSLELPRRKCVVQFILNDPPKPASNYWIVAKPGEETDLCYTDPRFAVDLYVVADLRALTAAWLGHSSFEHERSSGRITLTGNRDLARTITRWLRQSSFASVSPAPVRITAA